MREENFRLRRELRAIAREAENNEAIFRRFHELEMSLLNASSLPDLLYRIVRDTRETLGLDEVTLLLSDSDHEIRNLLKYQGPALRDSPCIRFADQLTRQYPVYGSLRNTWVGTYRKDHADLFCGSKQLASVALLPLSAQTSLLGGLNLASADPGRYTRHHASDFHGRLANVISLCLQNTINREKLLISGNTDLLTRCFNRRYLETRMPEELERAVRYSEPLCCLVLDVDHFKQVNDLYGHLAGDDVLREVARRIKQELRSSDLAVRYGGEEFVVLLIRTSAREAISIGERVRRRVAATPFRTQEGVLLHVTLSGGIAELPQPDGSATLADMGDIVLGRADTALYLAKAKGRNQIVTHGLG